MDNTSVERAVNRFKSVKNQSKIPKKSTIKGKREKKTNKNLQSDAVY